MGVIELYSYYSMYNGEDHLKQLVRSHADFRGEGKRHVGGDSLTDLFCAITCCHAGARATSDLIR